MCLPPPSPCPPMAPPLKRVSDTPCDTMQEYVELLATNLVEAQGDESSAAAGRVRGLVNELTGYACTMLKLNAEVMHNFMSREANAGSAASLQWRHILVRSFPHAAPAVSPFLCTLSLC